MRVLARRGVVASPHYLATGTGVNILRRGGSAVDAAIATNAVLAVVAPYACGLGGDLMALIYDVEDRKPTGLNGSGRAPAAAQLERVRELAGDHMPVRGPLPVTVPGCVDAWGQLHHRFGRLPLSDLLADAITYAEDGFPVTAEFAAAIEQSVPMFHLATPAREVFLPGGSHPREGQILSQPRLARTLRAIAAEGPAVFYRGALAEELVRALRNIGGIMTLADLEEHEASWEEPLFAQYRDIKVCELPPNSQGVIALMMLQILQQLPTQSIKEGEAGYIHLLAEVARLAYADREACLSDPEHMTVATADLLSERYARSRAARIEQQAMARAQQGIAGDTVYICVADAQGNLVSLNQSNWMGFGSGVMAGETGVMLHNRGAWFSLEPGHTNVIAPRKRTMHTLMPGMAFRDGEPWLLFGTMGGSAQAQIHVQLLTRIIDQDMTIDEALDAPRIDAVAGTDATGRPVIAMEGRFPTKVVDGLRRRGHAILTLPPYSSTMGHAHIIQISDGIYAGASDPRTHSLALGF